MLQHNGISNCSNACVMYVACVGVVEDGDFKTPGCTKTKRRHSEEQTHILLEVLSIKQWERTSLGCLRIDCEQSLFCPKICEQARHVSILAELSREHRVVFALVLAPAPIVARDFAASIHTHISFSLTDCLAKEAPAPKNKGTQVYADNEQQSVIHTPLVSSFLESFWNEAFRLKWWRHNAKAVIGIRS